MDDYSAKMEYQMKRLYDSLGYPLNASWVGVQLLGRQF